MKMSRLFRNILLTGTISLTLASCGGGGGNDSTDSTINQIADIIDNNTETQSNTLAPDSLSPGMKIYITGASRPDAVLSITSANTCTDSLAGECTYSYRKITNSTAKLDLQWGDYKESYSFAFKDMESGNAIWIWSTNGQEKTEDVKFRLEGRSSTTHTQTEAPGTSANNNSTGSAPSSSTQSDLAPGSLSLGKQIRIGNYLIFRPTNGIGNSGIITVSNTPYDGQIFYNKTGKDTASLKASYIAPSSQGNMILHNAEVKLTFRSKDKGVSEYIIENPDTGGFTNGIRRVTGGGQFFYEQCTP